MTPENSAEMYTVAKLAQAIGTTEGKVKKLIAALAIEPDEVKRGCKYYGAESLKKIKTGLAKL